MIRVGVIGYGYWGPNIVRNFHGTEGFHVEAVCDKSPESLQKAKKLYPDLTFTQDASDITRATNIDVVAVITPAWTHFELAKAALLNGKHVFVEKPFTWSSDEAEELIEIAESKRLKIMVDHTFLFTGAVNRKVRSEENTSELQSRFGISYAVF